MIKHRFIPFILLLILGLAACAKPDVVVLLPEEDGSAGALSVASRQAPDEAVTLDEPLKAARVGGGPSAQPRTDTFTQDEVDDLFGDVLSILPAAEAEFVFFFEIGAREPSNATDQIVEAIAKEVALRGFSDIEIIGHTDSLGEAQDNLELSKARIENVQELIIRALKDQSAVRIRTQAKGEAALPVATPDDVDDARNRIVLVRVR